MRFDHVAVLVLDEDRVALVVAHPQQFPGRRADADGENAHARLVRFLGGGNGFLLFVMVFAIREEDQNFMIVVAFFKGGHRCFDRFRQGRPALRDDADRDGIDRLLEGGFVERERRLQKGGAGKGDQAEAVRSWPGA